MEQNDAYISGEEREHLLSELHRFLVWVGEKLPEEIEVDREKINLHELIWHCLNDKQSSEEEKKRYMELIRVLESREKQDEEMLLKADLTHEEAKDYSTSLPRS